MRIRKALKTALIAVLIGYSVLHVVRAGLFVGMTIVGGDFAGTVPGPWVWKLNPTLARDSLTVQKFSGPELITHYDPEPIESPNRTRSAASPDFVTYCVKYLKYRQFKGCSETRIQYLLPEEPSCPVEPAIPFATGIAPKKWGYGIVTHLVTLPLYVFDSFSTLFRTWLIFSWVLLLFTFLAWYKVLFVDSRIHSSLVFAFYAFTWLNFFPLLESLTMGMIEIFELFLITVSFLLLRARRDKAGGIILGLAVMTKYLPFIFVGYLVFRKRWKAVVSAIGMIGILVVATHFSLGWGLNHNFSGSDTVAAARTKHDSQSLPSMIHRAFAGLHIGKRIDYEKATDDVVFTPSQRDEARRLSQVAVLSMLLFTGAILLARRRANASSLEIALLTIVMLEVLQYNHVYYFYFLLVPFSIAYRQLVFDFQRRRMVRFVSVVITAAAYLMIGIVLPGGAFKSLMSRLLHQDFRIEVYQAYSIPGLGCLLLFIWLSWEYLRCTRSSISAKSPVEPDPILI